MAVIEIARVDASMSTFLMVHNSLAMLTLGVPSFAPLIIHLSGHSRHQCVMIWFCFFGISDT